MRQPGSKKFNPGRWMERLVPIILVLLMIGLLVTILVVIFSLLGTTPV